jgi:hypothetical protein
MQDEGIELRSHCSLEIPAQRQRRSQQDDPVLVREILPQCDHVHALSAKAMNQQNSRRGMSAIEGRRHEDIQGIHDSSELNLALRQTRNLPVFAEPPQPSSNTAAARGKTALALCPKLEVVARLQMSSILLQT